MVPDHRNGTADERSSLTYSKPARLFHWTTAAAVLLAAPIGFTMAWRGGTLGIWDGLTNMLYSSHKALGFGILCLMLARLAYRLVHGAPADEPGMPRWHARGVHLAHWLLYALLLAVPFSGWLGVSLFPALDLFGVASLPALTAPDEQAAGRVLAAHGWLAILLLVLAGGHIAAALGHHLLRRDGVLRRMWPETRR